MDLALWDIAGKALGRPVYELLGGPRRDKVLPYASVQPRVSTSAEATRRIQKLAEKIMEIGYQAVKFQLVYPEVYTDQDIVRLMRLARRIVGDQTMVMLDVGYRWADSKSALWTLRQLKTAIFILLKRLASKNSNEGQFRSPAISVGRKLPLDQGSLLISWPPRVHTLKARDDRLPETMQGFEKRANLVGARLLLPQAALQ